MPTFNERVLALHSHDMHVPAHTITVIRISLRPCLRGIA